MRRARHAPIVTLFVVAGAGVLLGHSLGYAGSGLLGATSGVGHQYLDVVRDVLVPLGALGALVAILLDPRRHSLPSGWTGRRLAGLQSGLYLALETGERLAQGHEVETLLRLPVVAGFGAQLLVAVVVTQLVRTARLHLARLVEPRPVFAPASAPRCCAGGVRVLVGGRDRRPVGSRAPPSSRVLVAPR